MRKIREISPLLSDCYKFGHRLLYPEGTTYVYSTLTPRANSYFPYSDKMVSFGYEMFAQRWLVEHFNENFFNLDINDVVEDYKYVVSSALGEENASADHIIALHELGYLPILIKALPEGTLVPMKVPVLTIENTHDDFAWLTNFLETLLISETFVTSTVATMALELRKVATKHGIKTADDLGYIDYQCHDFSERGQHGNDASKLSGVAHLTSFVGSDTLQASVMAHNYYGADLTSEAVLKSVVASEHSVMQSYGEDELNTYRTLISRFPKGILSLVSDTYDYYGVLTNILPKLHDEIMSRDGKVVIRPDSGNPADVIAGKKIEDICLDDKTPYWNIESFEDEIYEVALEWAEEACEGSHCLGDDSYDVVFKHRDKYYTVEVGFEYDRHDKTYYYVSNYSSDCGVRWGTLKEIPVSSEIKGSLELLWDEFGGTINSKGYKVLDSHIGLLYGEGITVDTMDEILTRMEEKGFSAENIVFGVGAYVYSVQISRDSFAQAIKSQMVTINGDSKMIFKDPKTDVNHLKRSLKGKVMVLDRKDGVGKEKLVAIDGLTKDTYNPKDLLEPIFKDGEILRSTPFSTIRKKLLNTIK